MNPDTKLDTDDTKPDTKHAACFDSLSESERKLLLKIRDNPSVTQKKLAEESAVSISTIKRMIQAWPD